MIREWQRELVASVLDADPVPRLAGWLIARGNGKSSLLAALSVYKMFTSSMGGSIVCCARTQGQAQILFKLARDYVETSPELLARCQVGRERLYIPRNRTEFECLVSEPASLEGLNFSWCALDELGVTGHREAPSRDRGGFARNHFEYTAVQVYKWAANPRSGAI